MYSSLCEDSGPARISVEDSDAVKSITGGGFFTFSSARDNSEGAMVDEPRRAFFGGRAGDNCSCDGQESSALSLSVFLFLRGTCSLSGCGGRAPKCFMPLGSDRLRPWSSMKWNRRSCPSARDTVHNGWGQRRGHWLPSRCSSTCCQSAASRHHD